MKKFLPVVLFLFFLDVSPLFAAGGEIIISNGNTPGLTVIISTDTYAWKWDKISQKVIPEEFPYSKTYDSPTAVLYRFDATDNMNDNLPYIPWGLMKIKIITSDPASSKTFTLDTRDEDWSTDEDKYPSHDTYISKNEKGEWQISTTYHTEVIGDNQRFNIWSLWKGFPPVTTHFTIPVTLMNRTEGGSTDFGYLRANGNDTVNSGQSGMFCYNAEDMVSHGTTEISNNLGRLYSFKWTDINNVNPNNTQNYYNSALKFIIPENSVNKSITRLFHLVYQLTVKNSIGELGLNTDTIFFKDPTTTNLLEKKPASGSGFIKNEAFANLDEYINNIPHQKYALKAKNPITYGGRVYQWYGGDFNPSTQTDITITETTTKTAYYKGVNVSNTSSTFSNTSQRKFVRTDNGYLHLVYESMNHIWYERSADNGSTWQIMNGGKYLDQGATQSKLPSIASIYNDIAIVWQEECDGSYQIKLARFDENSNFRYTKKVYYGPAPNEHNMSTEIYHPLYSTNAGPVISFNSTYLLLVCWKKEIPQDSSSSGIWYKLGEAEIAPYYPDTNGDSLYLYQEGMVPGTTINSYTPTVSAATLWKNFALAWEERGYQSSIKYVEMQYEAIDTDPEGHAIYEIWPVNMQTVSNWSYYQRHYKPSIALINPTSGGGKLELSWVGERTYYENGVQKVQRNALYRRNTFSSSTNSWSWDGTTWSLGSGNVSAVNVNTTNSDGIIAWNEETGQSRYVRSSNLFSTKTLSFRGTPISGQGIQVNNGSDFNSVYGITFKNSALPYYFNTSSAVSSLGKTGAEELSSRTAVARLDNAVFYISSRLTLDGKSVGYSSKSDSIKSYDVKPIGEALSTSTFSPQAASSLSYNIEYGTLDTLFSMKALSKGQAIQCRLELQDMDNGSTLKVLENFSLDKLTMKGKDGSFRSLSGNMDVKKFAGRSLRMRLVIEDGINARWGLMERVLSPEDEKEIKKITSEKVMDYAISQNYPNPFNPSTVISYAIPKASKVSLKIYDMLGREVATLVDEVKGEGKYSVEFNASHLPSGIYIYEIRANDFVKSGKMMLLK